VKRAGRFSKNAAMPSWRVWQQGCGGHALHGEVIGIILWQVHLPIEGLLAKRLGQCAATGGPLDQIPGFGFEPIRGNGLVDESPVGRGGGIDGIAGHGHLQRALASDIARHRHQRGVTEQARLAARNGKHRSAGGHREVTTGHQLAPAGRCQRVDPGHDGLRKALDRVHHRGADPEQFTRLLQTCARHVGEIMAGAEHRAVGGQNHPARVGPRDRRQRGCQFAHHTQRQGIALLDAVQRHRGDRPVGRDKEMLVAHGRICYGRPFQCMACGSGHAVGLEPIQRALPAIVRRFLAVTGPVVGVEGMIGASG
jgi:hypothetical protein